MTLLFTAPTFRPLSITGAILPNAYVQFYVSGSTTPTNVYADAALGTPLNNPVVADADGEFVPIYLDRRVRYRAQIYDENDVLLLDVDPLGTTVDFQPGTVVMFFGDTTERDAAYPPAEWGVCDGTNGTPDLVGRFPKGIDTGEQAGDTGGAVGTVTSTSAGAHDHGAATGAHQLTAAEMPTHHHKLWGDTNNITTSTTGLGATADAETVAGRTANVTQSYIEGAGEDGHQLVEDSGGDGTHTHTIASQAAHSHDVTVNPPFCALWFLMRLP